MRTLLQALTVAALLTGGLRSPAAEHPAAPPPRPRLQIINGSSQPVDVFWLKSATERVPNGSLVPGKDTVITTTPGHRFVMVGRDDQSEAAVTSTVSVQAFRFGGVPAFYTQRLEAHGYPIVASARVNPYALKEAAYLVDLMLAKRPDVREAMIQSGSRLCILAWNEFTTDQPEFAWLADGRMPGHPTLSGREYWDSRARGLGGSETDPFCSCGEENLLCYPGDPYAAENILIHEFAHNLHLRGLLNVDPTFDPRLQATYAAAMKAGLWKGKYAAVNHHEYFAEGVQSWFDNNRENDHDHNHVNTRAELLAYDPGLAALCREVFGDTELKYTRPATRLTGHLAGYDPAMAPKFEWPERLRQARAEIRAAAQARDTAANGGDRGETSTHTADAVPKQEAAVGRPVIGGLESHAGISPRLAGNILISELSCAACHASANAGMAPKAGPDLSEAGSRMDPRHLQRFIANPSGTKPGTTMPDILAGLPEAEREENALALASYLASLGTQKLHFESPAADAVERGRTLYHSVGCVACHSPETPLAGSVPLGPLAEKYSVASLAAFLEDPLAVRPAGRMPDSQLDHSAAVDIASYLVRGQPQRILDFVGDTSLVERGKTLFAQHRCQACHQIDGPRSQPQLAAMDTLRPDRGCLSGQTGAWPRYPLAESQRAAIRTALAAGHEPPSVSENVELTLTRLNCLACHERNGFGGPAAERRTFFTGADENLGEQGRLPPPLTGVGAKLKAGWLRDVVVNGASVRPYLRTRMPKFGAASTGALADWFKQLDTLPPAEFTRVDPAEKPSETGRQLAGSQGFNCIACHTFREKSSAAIHALDLMTMTERLEENWFHHYLAQPQRFSPLTIMPAFWPDGKSALPDMLGGNPGRQRDALWQWLALGPEAGEPRGLVLESLVVAVKDEAVIIRRAFPGIGKRGIGVGYPAGIHLAFDAGQMRLASIWSGGFIEASGLWRGQGAGQASILGRDRVSFPAGAALAVLESPATAWPTNQAKQADGLAFKGYSLDAKRRPTFRYEFGGVPVEDTFLDVNGGGEKPHFVRTLKFPQRPPPPGLHFRVAVDKAIESRDGRDFAVGKGLRVRLSVPGTVREAGDARELLLPVTDTLTIEYHLRGTP